MKTLLQYPLLNPAFSMKYALLMVMAIGLVTPSVHAQTDTLPVSIQSKDRAGLQDPGMARVKTSATEFAAALSPIFNGTVSLRVDDEIMYPLNRYENQGIFAQRFATRAADYDRDVAVARARPQLRSDLAGRAFILAVRQMTGDGLAMQVRFKVKLPAIEGLSEAEQGELENDLAAAGEKAAAGGSGGLAVAKGIDVMRVMLEELANVEIVEDTPDFSVKPCDGIQPANSNYYTPTGELVQFSEAIKPYFASYGSKYSPFGSLTNFKTGGSSPQYHRALFRNAKLPRSSNFLGYFSDQTLKTLGYLDAASLFKANSESIDIIASKLKGQEYKAFSSVSGNQRVRVDLRENDITQTYIWQGSDLSGGTTDGTVFGGSIIPSVGLESSTCTFCTNNPGPGRAFYNLYYPTAQSDFARANICRIAQLFNKAGAQFAVNKSLDDSYWYDKMANYYEGRATALDPRTFEEALYEFIAWYADHFDRLPDLKDEKAYALSLLFLPKEYVEDIPASVRLDILNVLLNDRDHALEGFWPKGKNEKAILCLLQNVEEGKLDFIKGLLQANIVNKLFEEYNDSFDGLNYDDFIKAFMKLYNWYLRQIDPETLKSLVHDRIIAIGDVTKPEICNGAVFRAFDGFKCRRINISKNTLLSFKLSYPVSYKTESLQGKNVDSETCNCTTKDVPLSFPSVSTIVPIYALSEDISVFPAGEIIYAPAFIFNYFQDSQVNESRKNIVVTSLIAVDIAATIYGVKALTIAKQLEEIKVVLAALQVTRATSMTIKEAMGPTIASSFFKDPDDAKAFIKAWQDFNYALIISEAAVSIAVVVKDFTYMRGIWKDKKKKQAELIAQGKHEEAAFLDNYFERLARALNLQLDIAVDALKERILSLYIQANRLNAADDIAKRYAIDIAERLVKAGKKVEELTPDYYRLYSITGVEGDAIRKLLLSLIDRKWDKPQLFAELVADLRGNVKWLEVLASSSAGLQEELIVAWENWKILDVLDLSKSDPKIFIFTSQWKYSLFILLGKVKERNSLFFLRVNENPDILKFFEEGSTIIYDKAPNLKAVELDMYAIDRSRTGDQIIFESGSTDYKLNTTRKSLSDLDINQQTGKIRDQNGNIMQTDNVNGEGLMYVIDENDNLFIGGRGGVSSFPHPTLIGGTNPNVKCAGMIKFKEGRIFEVNTNSGHFKPANEALEQAEVIFRQNFSANSFDRNFKGFVGF